MREREINNSIIGGEAEAQCLKSKLKEFTKMGFSEEELEFGIITCSEKKDGARVYFKKRFLDLIKKQFDEQNQHKETVIFKKDGIFLKMNYGIGLAFIHYLMFLALPKASLQKLPAKKTELVDDNKNAIEKKSKYIRDHLRTILFCRLKNNKEKKPPIDVFYRDASKEYYAIIRITNEQNELQKIIISRRYPKNIIRAAARIFFG